MLSSWVNEPWYTIYPELFPVSLFARFPLNFTLDRAPPASSVQHHLTAMQTSSTTLTEHAGRESITELRVLKAAAFLDMQYVAWPAIAPRALSDHTFHNL